jgi:hypothetical protein
MTTPILDIEEVAENQDDKEITVNDALNALEAALCDWESLDLSAGNVSMTAGANLTAFRRNILLKTTGNGVARDLTLPAVKRVFVVWNAGSATLSVKVGSTTVTVDAGDKIWFHTDGTTNGLESIGGGGGGGGPVDAVDVVVDDASLALLTATDGQALAEQIDDELVALQSFGIPLSIPGKPGAAAIYHVQCVFDFRLVASLTGSSTYSGTNATSSSTFTLKKNGSSIGTLVFSSGGSTASITFASQTDFAAGDRLTFEAPASQDATLANVAITLKALRI